MSPPPRPPSPGPRGDSGFAWDAKDGYGLLFGGFQNPYGPCCPATAVGDTWTYNGTWTNISSTLSTAPSSRWALEVGMTYDAHDGYVLLFGGGTTGLQGLGDTWTFSGGQWSNLTVQIGISPPARYYASMAYDPASSQVILFGGTPSGSSPTYYNDTWAYSGRTWTQLHLSVSPSPRRAANMVYDAADQELVLFGGATPNGMGLNDTWVFKNGTWTELNPSVHPPARWIGAMAYDQSDQSVVLFGGCTSLGCASSLNDTWSFRGGNWTDLSIRIAGAPSPRGGVIDTFDPTSSRLLMFAGLPPTGYYSGDLWAYQGESWTLQGHASKSVIDLGQNVSFSLGTSGGQPPFAYSWPGLPTGCAPINGPLVSCVPTVATASHVTAIVFDSAGTPPRTWTTSFKVNTALAFSIQSNDAAVPCGQLPQTRFSAVITGGTPPYSVSWNFGDNTPVSSERNPSHSYTSPGTYLVLANVSDGAASSERASVNVSVPPASACGGFRLFDSSGHPTQLLYGLVGLLLAAAIVATVLAIRRKQRVASAATPPLEGDLSSTPGSETGVEGNAATDTQTP